MKKYTANAAQAAWLSERFGAVRTFSFTEGHETAFFQKELTISDGNYNRPVRGYGHATCDPVGDLFGFAAQVKPGEFFVQNGKRVDPNPALFNMNVAVFKAA